MKEVSAIISPEVKSAYFEQYIECAINELSLCLNIEREKIGYKRVSEMDFLNFQIEEDNLQDLSRLSFFQGIFINTEDGRLCPIDIKSDFNLHYNFIFGSKFKGKTNERFTQMMINVGLASIDKKSEIKKMLRSAEVNGFLRGIVANELLKGYDKSSDDTINWEEFKVAIAELERDL